MVYIKLLFFLIKVYDIHETHKKAGIYKSDYSVY